jgi:hypothetical protein
MFGSEINSEKINERMSFPVSQITGFLFYQGVNQIC